MTAPVIALLGAESTGKSTLAVELCRALDAHGLSAVAVPEYLREFCDARARTPTQAEQAHIADEQWRRIEAATQRAQLVLADTTPLMTAIYSEHVFGDRSLYPMALARQALCARTLLTGLDLPWQPDGLQRDGPQVRGPIDAMLRQALHGAQLPYAVVYGSAGARTAQALAALRPWLAAVGLIAAPHRSPAPAPAASPTPADRPMRLSARCRECLQADCEHRLFPPRPGLRG